MATTSLETVRRERSSQRTGLHRSETPRTNAFTETHVRGVRTPERIRFAAILTIEQLAMRAGISGNALRNIEAGTVKHLQPITLEKISKALKERFVELEKPFNADEYIDACLEVRK
jgi:DNA-binding Xre family transcriptional regulator